MNHTKLLNIFSLLDFYSQSPQPVSLLSRNVQLLHDLIWTWGNQMKLLNDQKQFHQTLQLFDEHKKNNMETLSSMIITQALKACAQMKDLQRGSTIHHLISSRVKTDPYILASLIHLYVRCGDTSRAQSLFDSSSQKALQLYGAMMTGYVKTNQAKKAIGLFGEIKNPDAVIIIILFNACAQLGTTEALSLVNRVSSEMPKSFYSNSRLSTSLVDALMKCGDVAQAQSLFSGSPRKSLPMYGAMMKGYVTNNQAKKAVDLFNEIKSPDEIVVTILFYACAQLATPEALYLVKKVSSQIPQAFHSNPRLSNSLLNAFIRCGDCSSAEIIFPKIKRSVIAYGNLMNGFNKENSPEKTIKLFHQMNIDGVEPNSVIYLCIIKALSQIGDSSLCQSVVQHIPHSVAVDDQVHNALIDMWGKAGCVDRAKELFDSSSQQDQYTYTAMINSYGLNGMGSEAVELFHQIPSAFLDEINYVCVLNGCSHSGLVAQARSIFAKIPVKTDKIYTVMIDCLSRASMFEEAQALIDEYECHNQPAQSMHMALLSGARNENNSHLSQQVFDRMEKLFPHSTTLLIPAAILLANVYGSSGELDKASDIRIELDKSGEKKTAGVSRIVIGEKLFEFRAHDRSHPFTSEIYVEAEKISQQLAEHGHRSDSTWITRPLHPDETVESALCGHSERLAIAFAFVMDPTTTRIQLTKNLRICGDCHRATKLIAHIRQCEIIVRDANRIHHFGKNAQCSCNDYF